MLGGAGGVHMQQRDVAGADVLDCAVRPGATHDERCVLPRERALAEETICRFDQFLQRDFCVGETSKRRVQMAHQHRSGDAFSGDVAE